MNLLSIVVLFPLLGFIILALSQGRWPKNVVSMIGVGSIGISTCITTYIVYDFFCNTCDHITFACVQKLWTWFVISDLHVGVSFRLDRLSVIMLLMITGIGFIIHMYASWYMYKKEGYSRFFSYTNFFMFNMMILVLSDDLLLMYFGWEGVGFCSYLLIGFYYLDKNNGTAAFKAFIMTRFGDVCLICAFLMIYDQYHTLNISELLILQKQYVLHHTFNNITWISCMLLIGAIAKSAQFPLHTWLISAMVGPTPVSALIHAATMVTSGVYLITRMSDFFLVSSSVLYFIGVIGAVTLVLSSCSALFQNDIKKILAYSTVSQIGYMFLALGGGHWIAAIFHVITHAFFKALLFLAAGSLIYLCNREQNIFKMGGLYKSAPLIYICFLIGGASLSAFPVITAGFYSKELILLTTLSSHDYFFWISGLIGAFLTPVYIFRMIFIVFHGKQKIKPYHYNNNFFQNAPLIVLCFLSTYIGGYIRLLFSDISINIDDIFDYGKIYFEVISGILVIFGIWVALYVWLNTLFFTEKINRNYLLKNTTIRRIVLLCYNGWGFDNLYKIIFVNPYLLLINKLSHRNLLDFIPKMIISLFFLIKDVLKYSINGELNWYIASINIGAIIVLVIVLSHMNIIHI